MTKRQPAWWMDPLDERVLEILERQDTATPGYITREVPLWASVRRTRERCRVLTQAGMIEPLTDQRGSYELREKGAEYLAGDLDARNLPTPPLAQGMGTPRG